MRTIAPMLLFALVGCEPSIDGPDGVPDPADTDIDTDADTDPQVPAGVPCDGSYIPSPPPYPTDLPTLSPMDVLVDETAWSPAQPTDRLDFTDPGYDPRAALPETFPELARDDWPSIGEDPRDLTDALLQQRRFDGGEWETLGAVRLDEAGRLAAEYALDGRGGVVSVRLHRYGEGVRTQLELRYRGDYIASGTRRAWITEGDITLELHQQFPLDASDPETAWRQTRDALHIGVREGSPRRQDELGTHDAYDAIQPFGQRTRWFDTPATGPQRGVRLFVWDGKLSAARPQIRIDEGQTQLDYLDSGRVMAETLCPPDEPDTPHDSLIAWFVDGELNSISRRSYDDPRSYRDDRDQDGDGIYEAGTEVIFDWAGLEESVSHWVLDEDGARVVTATGTTRFSEGFVALSSEADQGRSSWTYRTVAVE